MAREIKFRVWDKVLKQFILEWTTIREALQNKYMFLHGETEINQYTWLKDKKGEEIYEGDIIESDTWERRIVEWNNYEQWYKLGYNIVEYWIHTAHIVGNIYENQDLIS